MKLVSKNEKYPFEIQYAVNYKVVVATPEDSVARTYEDMNELIVDLKVPKSEYKKNEDVQKLLAWAKLPVDAQEYYRDIAINLQTMGDYERSIVFTHGEVRTNVTAEAQADYVTIKVFINQKADKYVGVAFGKELEETYKAAKERVQNPPRLNIVLPVLMPMATNSNEIMILDNEAVPAGSVTNEEYASESEYKLEHPIYLEKYKLGKAQYHQPKSERYFPIENIISALPMTSYTDKNKVMTISTTQQYGDTYNLEEVKYNPIEITIDYSSTSDNSYIPSNKVSVYSSVTYNKINLSLSFLYKNKELLATIEDARKMITLNNYFKTVELDDKNCYHFRVTTTTHANINAMGKQNNVSDATAWSLWKVIDWQSKKIPGGMTQEEYIHKFKLEWLKCYKDVIKKAAGNYNIPDLVLAGVLYVEIGG